MPITGNASYAGYAAFAIGKTLKKDWTHCQVSMHPVLSFIYERGLRWNKGSDKSGLKMLVPVVLSGPTNAAEGVTDANEIASPLAENARDGFTQAAYEMAHYRARVDFKESEKTLLADGALGSVLDGAVEQIKESFRASIAAHISGTGVGTRAQVLGVYCCAASDTTVGGIAQATDTAWATQRATIGTLTLQAIDTAYDAVRRYTKDGPDLMLASYYSSGVNVYGRFRSLFGGEPIVNADFSAKYGWVNFMYLGATVVCDYDRASNGIALLTTKDWFFRGDSAPQLAHNMPIPGTDADELIYKQWIGLGCGRWKSQYFMEGITG